MKKIFLLAFLIFICSSLYSQVPNPPILISPPDYATNVSLFPNFLWQESSGATSYRLQISTGPQMVFDQSGITGTSYILTQAILTGNTSYSWCMNATGPSGTGGWSGYFHFTTATVIPTPPNLLTPPNGAINVPIHPTFNWSGVSGATAYILQVSKSPLFDSLVVNDTTPLGTITLENSTTYYWRVCALFSGGAGNWSNIFNFTTIMAVPSSPILISPPNGSSLCPPYILDWSDVPTAISYRVQISLNISFTQIIADENITISQYTFPVGQGSSFYWKVCAINGAGQGPWSTPWQAIGGGLTGSPGLITPPNGMTGVPNNNIIFNWNYVSGASAYILQISKFPLFDSLVVNDTTPLGTITLQGSTTYYWRVCGMNSCGAGNWSSVWNFTTMGQVPDPPTLLSPPDSSVVPITGVIFDWSDVPTATSYRIQISTSPTFSTTVLNTAGLANSAYILTIPILTSNTMYYWRVNATNTSGTSPWSSVWRFITASPPLSPPSLLYPPNNSINISLTPTLDWTDVTGATSYVVQVSSGTSSFDTIVVPSTLTIPPGKLNYFTQYYWRVAAINNGGQSPWSSMCNFRTINSVGINLISSEIPAEYKLFNNYPNPFNPATIIRFQIKDLRLVTLKIYDILGKEAATLVDEKQSPGIYEVSFDGSNLPSGMYFYTIRSGDFSDTKKMLLIK